MMPRLLVPFILFVISCCLVSCEQDDADVRNNFLGQFEVLEYSITRSTDNPTYEVNIRKSRDEVSQIIIFNFYNMSIDVFAEVDGNNINIPFQKNNVFEITGSGRMHGSLITLEYTVITRINEQATQEALEAEYRKAY
jgi:hypothetical protein